MLLLCVQQTSAQSIYIYEAPDGSRLFTDHIIYDTNYLPVNHTRGTTFKPQPLTAKKRNRYDNYIAYASRKNDVSFALIKAVIHAESHFEPAAVSKAGAIGLMQLMPTTAQQYAVTDLHNPRQNILAGTEHLAYLLKLFEEDITLTVAAYNAGEGNVKKYNGIPPFQETQRYVKKVARFLTQYEQSTPLGYR